MSYRERIARGIACAALMAGIAATVPSSAQAQDFKWPEFPAVVKDMQVSPGLVTIFRNRSDDPTKDQTRLLCQIPRQLMKQDLLLAISFSHGANAGYQGNTYLIRFDILGRNVIIESPDVRFVQNPGQPVSDVVARTHQSEILAAMPIVTIAGPDPNNGDPVVDMSAALLDPSLAFPGAGGGVRRELSEYAKVKAFPDNVLIDVSLAVGGGGSVQRLGVTYDIRRLPPLGSYQPRVADERVGYFTTVRQDWGIKHGERENVIRYVDRWDLKKKDPSLELSPPERPITFVIEKTVPLQWRKYVAEGITEWNKAFEKLGIAGAVVAQQQTDDNEFANIDPEDARYSFIRWIVTGNPFAMGPHRADPRTGQILDANIIFDDSMLRYYHNNFEVFGPHAMASVLGPDHLKFLLDHPEFIVPGQSVEEVREAAQLSSGELMQDIPFGGATTSANTAPRSPLALIRGLRLRGWDPPSTGDDEHDRGRNGKELPERFIGEVIREVVTHEVGHTLGLRHNFKASSWLSLDEIRRRRDSTDDPTVASVMDYNPVLYFPGDDISKMHHFITPTIGPYDYFAIEYGYQSSGHDEKATLAGIASEGTKRENAYATDEDTMGLASPDPLVNRYDMGDDPIAWAKLRNTLCDGLMKDIRSWAVKKDEPNYYLRQAVGQLLSEKVRNMVYVSRLVGGQNFNRNRPADPDSKPALVLLEPKKQREALAMLSETVFSDKFASFDSDLLNQLPPGRWMDWADQPSARIDYPIHQTIMEMQSSALMAICSPQTLQRVYDAELKSNAEDKFTAAELITSVRDLVWNNLSIADDAKYSDAKPMLTSVRRNLQRQHLQYQLAISDSQSGSLVSPDLRSMVRLSLRELSDRIGGVIRKARTGPDESRIDFATRAHLIECKNDIDHMLNAPHIKFSGVQAIIVGDGEEARTQSQQSPGE